MKINYINPRNTNTLAQTNNHADSLDAGVDCFGFTGKTREYTETLLNLFKLEMTGTRNNKENSAVSAVRHIRSFMAFTRRPIWEWTKRDLPEFFLHKSKTVIDGLSIATQACYITYLRILQNYLFTDIGLRNEIHSIFGVQLQEWVDGTNSIVIKRKNRKRKKLTFALTPEELTRLLAEFDASIKLAFESGSKSAYPLARDKIMTIVMYVFGLRISEAVAMHTWNFQPDSRYPQFKDFAIIVLIGKGDYEGSVHALDPDFANVMEWYMKFIRPHFQSAKTKDPELLFYSERGGTITDEQMRKTLKKIAMQAGIKKRVSPHVIRRSNGTDSMDLLGAVGTQKQLRHADIQTTFNSYYRPDPDEYGRNVANAIGMVAANRNKSTSQEKP